MSRPTANEDATPLERRSAATAAAAWLAVVLVGAKGAHWGWPGAPDYPLAHWARDWAVSAYQDVLFAVAFGAIVWLALRVVARSARGSAWTWRAVVACGAFAALYAVAAVKIFGYLRSPLTYPLLYLAGGLKDMRSSIHGVAGYGAYLALASVPAAYVLVTVVSVRRGWLRPLARRRAWLAVALLALGAYALAAHRTANGRWTDRGDALIVRNPHWAFVESLVALAMGQGTPSIGADFPPEYLADFTPPAAAARSPRLSRPPRNVLVVVLESTAARYTSLYRGAYRSTPMLEREAQHALVGEAHYTPVGLTANVLVALNLSIYPYMTWREYTLEYPDYPGTTLAQMLKARGRRTMFIHTGHLNYTNQDGFLAGRGFDEVLDWDDMGGGPTVSSWGGDDRLLVDKVLDWIDRDRAGPFFAMAWTINSHHPYEPAAGQEIVDFFAGMKSLPPDDYDLGRYLNTIHETDRQIGRLFDGLRARGLADDTLVVVTGDHGQGFGWPHATWGHGFRIYDENVRVPLMIWNPRLFPAPRRTQAVTSHVDLNATIADILELPPAPDWQGRSILDPARPQRAYFYAANDLYLLGVREERWKYLYNATRGEEALFDLSADPDEQQSLAKDRPEDCRRLRQRLAAWKAFVEGELARVGRERAPER